VRSNRPEGGRVAIPPQEVVTQREGARGMAGKEEPRKSEKRSGLECAQGKGEDGEVKAFRGEESLAVFTFTARRKGRQLAM